MKDILRLERKLRKKDDKIKGLNKRIAELERHLARFHCTLTLTNIEDAVTRALTNIRLIPTGLSPKDSKILEIIHRSGDKS